MPTKMTSLLATVLLLSSISSQADTFIDNEYGFSVKAPDTWEDLELSGQMRWHVSDKGKMDGLSCGVMVNNDWSFALTNTDEYIRSLTKKRLADMLAISYENARIGVWDPNYFLGTQRAMQFVFSGTVGGRDITVLSIQTIRNNRMYTFSCSIDSIEFYSAYLNMLKISDTFKFAVDPTETVLEDTNPKDTI